MYQTRVQEMQKYKEMDPILVLRNHLCDKYGEIGEELDSLDKKALTIVAEAEKFAEESPDPTEADLVRNVYV
jgi:pyruvate dehydrogenase E1 component alpha subunit